MRAKLVKSVAAVFFFAALSTLRAQTLNVGNGHYYKLFESSEISWSLSRAKANSKTFQGLQGHLATITSADENQFVGNLIDHGPVWIGGTQAGVNEPSGGWQWENGEAWSYTNWAPGQPDNDGAGFGNENRMALGSVTSGEYRWGDLPNSGGFASMRGYVVEYEAVPEPATMLVLALGAGTVIRRRRKR